MKIKDLAINELNKCVICDDIIPEGIQYCNNCENAIMKDKENKKKITKTTNWLTKDMTQEEIKKIKEAALKEADKELAQIEEREKQIEEMTNIVHNLYDKLNQDAITTNDIINELVKQGYQKVDKDSIVLTKEDLKHYAKDCILGEMCGLDIINALIERAKRREEQAHKETTEKDFNTIIQALEERKDRVKAFYGVNESVGIDIAIKTIKELAKQYGVDLKE